MTELTEKQARLTALKKARDTGVLTVNHGDTSTTFRSISEIERIIAALSNEIASLAGTSRRSARYIRQGGKGL